VKRLFDRSLAVRVYLFALACVGLMLIAQIVFFMTLRAGVFRERLGHFARGQAMLMASQVDDPRFEHTLELLARSGMDSTIVDAGGTVLASAGQAPPPIDAALIADIRDHGSVQLDDDVVAVAMPGAGPAAVLTIGLMRPAFSLTYSIAIIAGLLIVMLGVSAAFARSLTRPLGQLSAAARRFGSGDLSARTDMTRRDQLGDVSRAFDEMAERITSLLEANQALVGAVSHELRTPISRIRVALDLAAEDPAAVHELLAGVSSDLTELERLVDDTLTMARLEAASGAPPLHVEPIAPVDLVARARDGWQHRHGERQLVIDVAADLPPVSGDPVLLRRALDNLLDNAAKYAPRDTPVELRVTREDSAVWFAVIDRGPGMTADEIEHAFTPFWRSDASRARDTGGVGLGLCLARQLAHAHRGEIRLTSAPGQGMCAVLQVPMLQKQSETCANDPSNTDLPD